MNPIRTLDELRLYLRGCFGTDDGCWTHLIFRQGCEYTLREVYLFGNEVSWSAAPEYPIGLDEDDTSKWQQELQTFAIGLLEALQQPVVDEDALNHEATRRKP